MMKLCLAGLFLIIGEKFGSFLPSVKSIKALSKKMRYEKATLFYTKFIKCFFKALIRLAIGVW